MTTAPLRLTGAALGTALVLVVLLPLAALVVATSPDALARGASHQAFGQAIALSLGTSALSVGLMVVCGTPLAFWLARRRSPAAATLELALGLPVVIPPAVVGVGLLMAFGRHGLLGPALDGAGIQLPFTTAAVVLAQLAVSAPFYVQGAATAFRAVDEDTLIVARTLGASPAAAFFKVALPIALPGLVGAAALAWARALGELGATLLFAGSLAGETRTVPLAILAGLEVDVALAVAFALVLVAIASVLFAALRRVPRALDLRRRAQR